MSHALDSGSIVNSVEMKSAKVAAHSSRAYRYACYAALIFVLAFFAAIRFHFRNMPLERDEGEYAYMGQLMLQGVPPFKLAYTMKLPGTSMAYAAMMAVFGQTVAGIRIGMMVVTTLCSLLVFLLAKRLCGLLAGTIAGITYVFLAIRPGVLGMEGHATHFVVLAALAGLLLFLRAIDHPRVILFFASGLLFGLSFLMKQPGIFFGFFAGCYWLWREWKTGWRWQNALPRGAALIAGTVLPYAMVCWWMLQAGVFANFWFWTWTYARAYGTIISLHDTWQRSLRYTLPWAVRPFVLWEIALVGLAAPLWSRYARLRGGFVAGFFLTSVLAVCPGLYFRSHYFILLLPAVALGAGIAVECAARELRSRNLHRLLYAPTLLFALAFLLSVRGQWRSYLSLTPADLSRKLCHDGQACTDNELLADLIEAKAKPGDQIGIIGSEPEICFYSRLRCASHYIYAYPLMETQPFASQMQTDLLTELQDAHPRFLIFVDDERSWGWTYTHTLDKNRPFFQQAWRLAHAGYNLLGEVPIPDTGNYADHLRGDQPTFYVFQRESGP
jgi:hypothetical protein